MNVVITGSSGLIGSEAVEYYAGIGCDVIGIDNNMREKFFGSSGSTIWNRDRLLNKFSNFKSYDFDIRDNEKVSKLFKDVKPDLVIHSAAQPSHDLAARMVVEDFTINANGTLTLLEAFRNHCPSSVFIHISTNKVYGDNPNKIEMKELELRYDYKDKIYENGIPESLSIDDCTHSFFGVSKAAGDLLAQEFGRYFDLNVGIFRGGCLTGPVHSSVELHGFLSYLVKCIVNQKPYTIFGYKGKQVRDQIHSKDVILAFESFRQNPRKGEVYNIGGGKNNSISILESIKIISEITGNEFKPDYAETNRIGDHICYYSDLSKLKSHFPQWDISEPLIDMINEMIEFESQKLPV
ncbi:MAG: NAD-dependent epimerase/dehydratase family protein [Bacteroidetes bacterium]|nr:NAD-dependent epimerase/dehydratase family protein [Bacteroidota bacterium]